MINLVNGKMYIGKTESNIEKRFQEHIKDSKRERCKDRPLYRAINKYGIENFKIELLEESDNSEEREQYYIKKFNTYGSTGYNATLGGDSKRYLNYEDIIKCYEKYQNITKVAELKGCHVDSVRSVLKNNNIKIQQPNVHGHIHGNDLGSDKHFNVSMDVIGFKPIELEKLMISIL
ncbi:MAG: GIY-YIG nuclease family protein [Candidatus Caldatribacteriota bacterium]